MIKNKKLSLIFSFILLAGMLLMFGSAASAKDASTQDKGTQPLQTALDQLVKEEVLTKEKANEVRAYFGKRCEKWQKRHEEMKKLSPEERKAKRDQWLSKNKDRKHGFTNKLVEDKILTQDQADALKAKLKENFWQQKKERAVTGINGLVSRGVLNQQQADKVLKQFEQTRSERRELFKKTQNMSPEERHQFFKENQAKLKSPIEQLVKDGVINEEQAKAVKEVLPQCKGQMSAHNKLKS